MRYFEDDYKVVKAINTTAAGQTTITSSAVDTLGFEGACFMLYMGAITSGGVQSAKIQQSSDDGAVDAYSDLLGSSQTIADDDDNEIFVFDIKPTKRYLKIVVARATQDSAIGSCCAVLYGAKAMPVTHGTGVNVEAHNLPDEGTA